MSAWRLNSPRLIGAVVWTHIRNICLAAGLIPQLIASPALAKAPLPRSVLILDQQTSFRPWPTAVIAGIRSFLREGIGPPVSVYVEHLDLNRFEGSDYEGSLQTHFREKYRDRPIGVIVAIGPSALNYALRLRAVLWSTVPIVFAAVDEETAQGLPSGVTGTTMQLNLANMIKASRMLVPGLMRLAFVGDPLARNSYYSHFSEELPIASQEFEIIDLTGVSIGEVRGRVAALPDHTAILYFGINFDHQGTYVGAEVLPLIAEAANRPIVINVEPFLGSGATGGFILSPNEIGQEAGQLVRRVLGGEDASSIPVTRGNSLKPIFDWRQLRRWNIGEDRLPQGSEMRFRQPSMWAQYGVHILGASAVLLLQTMLIFWLLYEHRRRQIAEVATRNSMSELTQMNRLATAGELSASIAHEVNQPLTGIVTKADAALHWLAAEKPDLDKTRAALTQIVRAGHRASEIIASIRSMLRKDTQDRSIVDINKLIWTVLRLVRVDLQRCAIELETKLNEQIPAVLGNEVQLQQVILNLVMNAIESMHSRKPRVLHIKSDLCESGHVLVSIEDTGTGIDPSKLDSIFKPLFTTKATGMGMGLSICRSIIESHDGRIWVSAGVEGGSIFQFSLPVQL
jgi:signal transduction histidine kinase